MSESAFSGASGIAAIFVVMLLKEIGIPVPIPSDLLMIGAGLQLAAGAYGPLELTLAIGVAVLVGGSVQFIIARSAGRAVVFRVAARVGVGAASLDPAVSRLGAGGGRAIFVGMNVPGARAAVIPAAGLAGVAFLPFVVAALAGSLIFYGWHVALGYLVGPAAVAIVERSVTLALAVVAAIIAIGAIGWLVARRRGASQPASAWTQAACPACIAAVIARR